MNGDFKGVINFNKVNKWFGEFQVLRDIDLSIQKGECIVLCGPSGSGKSTLIRCINRLETHDQGLIEIQGVLLAPGKTFPNNLLGKIGMVFQDFNLFPHMTVLNNLTLAPIRNLKLAREEAEQIALTYLERVHIRDQANKYPDQLSGGQQQRVAIARALCMKPEILLFDEPTSSLDPEMIKEVLDVMIELAHEGMTMIVVSHEMGFAKEVADKIVMMDEGMIIEERKPKEFFTNPKKDRTRHFLSKILN